MVAGFDPSPSSGIIRQTTSDQNPILHLHSKHVGPDGSAENFQVSSILTRSCAGIELAEHHAGDKDRPALQTGQEKLAIFAGPKVRNKDGAIQNPQGRMARQDSGPRSLVFSAAPRQRRLFQH